MDARWIDDDGELEALIDRVVGLPAYALDTEFHRERTYFPKLALVQLATESELALIDPLAIEPRRLAHLFASPAVAVLHAAQQDLDVLTHACGAVPAAIYDTQLAAGFLGYSTPSLSALLQGELRVPLAKGDRLTDWLHRPLTAEQKRYAADDVAHLLGLRATLDRQLDDRGRAEWVATACEELRTRPVSGANPADAWLRVKDARSLRAKARGVASAVAEWRERRAMQLDLPVRHVLPDLAILGISQRQPATTAELAKCRGVDERHSRGRPGEELLAAVRAGLDRDVVVAQPEGDDVDRQHRPSLLLAGAWLGELARRERIDGALLATRADLVAFVRGDRGARLRHGWRAELIGDGVNRLLTGHAGLAVDGRGGLKLIELGEQPSSER